MGPISIFQSSYLANNDDYNFPYLLHHIIWQYKIHLNELGWYAGYKKGDTYAKSKREAQLQNFIQFWLLGS